MVVGLLVPYRINVWQTSRILSTNLSQNRFLGGVQYDFPKAGLLQSDTPPRWHVRLLLFARTCPDGERYDPRFCH
jgi:hypothetical protein